MLNSPESPVSTAEFTGRIGTFMGGGGFWPATILEPTSASTADRSTETDHMSNENRELREGEFRLPTGEIVSDLVYRPKSNDLLNRRHASPPSDGFYERNPWQRKADEQGVPLIPPRDRKRRELNPVVAICGECGRKVHQIEMYSCANGNCPLQPVVNC